MHTAWVAQADCHLYLIANFLLPFFFLKEVYAAGASETQLGVAVKQLEPALKQNIVIGSKVLPNHCGKCSLLVISFPEFWRASAGGEKGEEEDLSQSPRLGLLLPPIDDLFFKKYAPQRRPPAAN